MRLVILDNSQTRPQVEAIDAVDRANIGPWFEGVIDEMSKLPWDRPDWSSEDPRPLSIAAVAELMLILLEMVPEYGTPPQMSPTWSGGVMAVWELGDFCLAIETAPDRRAQYFYVDERDGNDFGEEGDVPGNEERVRRWAINIADAIAELH